MLEDFFTLTEIKDGISTTIRIEELILEIRKLKDVVDINIGDSIRQCATAASTLASTKKEECLQYFVQLNGPSFLREWLQEAQNCSNYSSNVAEDLIYAILAALGQLPIDNEQSTLCGIKPTVEQLLTHENTKINQKARMLCQKWSSALNDDMNCQQKDKEETCQVDQLKPKSTTQETENDRQDETSEAATAEVKSATTVTRCLEVPLTDPLNDENACITNQPHLDGNAILGDVNSSVSSLVSHGCKETSASKDVELAPHRIHGIQSDDQKHQHAAQVDITVGAESLETNKLERSLASNSTDMDQNVSCNLDKKRSESFASDILQPQTESVEDVNQHMHVHHCLRESAKEKSILGDEHMKKTALGGSDNKSIDREVKLKRSKYMEVVSLGDSSKVSERKVTAITGENSELFTEYDDTDALEVARQVAVEVEREVIDYREAFCSSPEVNSGGTGHAASPELAAAQHSELATEEMDKSPDVREHSGSSSSLKEDGSGITDDSGPFSRKHVKDSDMSPCLLDLNANNCSEEIDFSMKPDPTSSVNLPTPIAVTASKGILTFPAERLQFEGELGWKGSASTSAFRPASPRRTPEGEKILPAPAQKVSNAMFDLNVAGSEDDAVGSLSTVDLPTSLGIAYWDSSAIIGLSTGRRLDLDLNCPCEEASTSAAPSFREQFLLEEQNRPSSSLSSRQHAVRDFDLNNNGSLFEDSSSQGIDESSVKTSGKDTSEHSAVKIMGTRITLGQGDYLYQTQRFFPVSGPHMEASIPARPVPTYAHMPPPNYSAISYSTGSAAMSSPPAFYGPGTVPYMIDSKGTPVIAPMMGLGLISQPHFASGTSAPSSNEFGHGHRSMDLNYGMLSMEAARKEGGGFRPMSFQGHTMLIDENTRNVSQGASSRMLLKRKEPDSGCGHYYRR